MEPKDLTEWAYWIDKVAIALLLVLAGFVANFVVERAKSQWALNSEMAKERVLRISEVMSELYKYDGAVARMLMAKPEDHRRLSAAANSQSEKARDVFYENRFWLGDGLYHDVLRLQRHIVNLAAADPTTLANANLAVDEARIYWGDVIGEPWPKRRNR